MPELPEVESARSVIARVALGRVIVDVDDTDTYECRPHRPGEIRTALLGRTLTDAHRRGKSMWCDTSPVNGSAVAGPPLGIHLGMSGKIVVAASDGTETDGGDYWDRGRQPGDRRYLRFSLTFDDGGSMALIDPRRLGRVRLDPLIDRLGPDAGLITPSQFRAALARGSAPVKARLLDQESIAGIGNLLADQILWQARISPGRSVQDLSADDISRLLRAVRQAIRAAVAGGGVHTLSVVPFRKPGGRCPRDNAPMVRSTVGGRTTWRCSREQP
ncbi:formamidopyrimidine-DNA glycosylase [Nakamurella panacisegetis]|uniref:Formamidopyrimidine-DNA glycosylase n=1 Tax=Nakamurella panacisegetis TaxID=1090615 RepID=A0A1H0QK11_9ACTN|nr:DNA-formamidopyrimidine glycosylase family protein [Nakamurella panacisegetis]SDP17654.1 formamidopyrimidine-DNA glycosylase [Nakamurella panacisegetis]